MKSKSKFFNRKLANVAGPLVVIAVIVLGLYQIPFVSWFLEWAFAWVAPAGLILCFLITAISSVYFAFYCLSLQERIAELEQDKQEQKTG